MAIISPDFSDKTTIPKMTQTILDFETELYQEHLEEASFLYEQRLTLFDDPEITWLDIADFEERFEAHIDGLVVGEEPALNVCKTQAMEGDFGELHAAVRVFCRQNRLDFVQEKIWKIWGQTLIMENLGSGKFGVKP